MQCDVATIQGYNSIDHGSNTVSVSPVPRKYTIPAIKPVLLQNVPKKIIRLYRPISAVLSNIDILVGTIKKNKKLKKNIKKNLFNLIYWLMYLS